MPGGFEPPEGFQMFGEEDGLGAEHLGATAWTESRLDDLEGDTLLHLIQSPSDVSESSLHLFQGLALMKQLTISHTQTASS